MNMKGLSMPVKMMGRILITVFVIGMIVILLMTFLPELSNDICKSYQLEGVGDLISDANSANVLTIKTFTVESCLEYIDFSSVECVGQTRGEERFGGDAFYQRCYEFRQIGQASGNCGEFDDIGYLIGGETLETEEPFCDTHKGTFRKFPGGFDNIDIVESEICSPTDCRLTPGKYIVETGQHSIKFSKQ